MKIGKEETVIIDGVGDPKTIQERAAQLRAQIEEAASDYDRKNLEDRLASIAGGVAVLSIERHQKWLAMRKKIGLMMLYMQRALLCLAVLSPAVAWPSYARSKRLIHSTFPPEEAIGKDILFKAVRAPIAAIATNCGEQGELIAEKVFERKGALGYNGITGEIEDLLQAGVIDPVLVTKSALKNAASIAGLLITVACMVTDKPEPKKTALPDMDGMLRHDVTRALHPEDLSSFQN